MKHLWIKFCWWLAFKLPPRIALCAFIRVHGISDEPPCSCGYIKNYDLWVKKHDLK